MTTTVLAYIPSPPQGVWHLGPFPVRAYALFIIAGIIAALVIGDRRWVSRGGEPGVIYDIALWAVPFGLIGGRLYHVLTDWRTYFGEDGVGAMAALRIWDGGLGIWGAVALGGVGAWIACRRRGIPLPAFGDAIAPGIVLAQGIGRLGNYFNQELYGRETTLPWGLEIYERVNAAGVPDSLNGVSTGELIRVVHPTFLYELLWNLLVFAALILVDRRCKIGYGRLFAVYVAGYCLGRFWIELMRSDTATELAGIRINSFTSTFVFIGAVVYIMAAPKGREDPAALRGHPAVETGADDLARDAAVASAVGIVAAAKVADEDEARESAQEDADVEALVAELEGAESGDRTGSSGGVGSVDSDEVAEAVAEASEAHEVAVEGEADAEVLAAEVDVESVTGSEEAAEGDAAELVAETEAEPGAQGADVVEAEPEPESAALINGESVAVEAGGVGSVDSDEVAEAVAEASEAHEVAVEGEADAEVLAAEVDVESVTGSEEAAEGDAAELVAETEAEPGAQGADVVEAEPEPESAASVDDESVAVEAGGVGSVDSDEVAEAVAEASEAHEVAVEGEADAEVLAAEVDVESVTGSDDAAEGEAKEWVAETEAEATAADGEPRAPQADPEAATSPTESARRPALTESFAGTVRSEVAGRVRQWIRRRRDR